jgi:hypothetical protein
VSEALPSAGQSPSDADLLDEFILDAEVQGMTEKTRVTYRSDLENFIEWLDCPLTQVTQQELKGFLAHLKNERTARDGACAEHVEHVFFGDQLLFQIPGMGGLHFGESGAGVP